MSLKPKIRYVGWPTRLLCNSRRIDVIGGTDGGKADHFPLRHEPARAYLETDDIDNEEPMLLDPCDSEDWKLLGCSLESGQSVAATNDKDDAERVAKSIEFYHLHQEDLKKFRLTQIRTLDQRISDAKDRFEEMDGSPKRTKKFNAALAHIKRLITPGAHFSGEMYNHVKRCRHNGYPWLEKLVG